MRQSFKYFAILGFVALTGCKKDDDSPSNPGTGNNQGEIITTLKLLFTDSLTGAHFAEFVFRDPDGAGGNGPVEFDTIRVATGTNYEVNILLLDETKIPVDTISNEVLEEAVDHMFFFHHTGTNITTVYQDADSNGLPLGLYTTWTTGSSSAGSSRILLKHQPGTKDGTEGPGETDVDVTFVSEIL
jgi:hypothetical protein